MISCLGKIVYSNNMCAFRKLLSVYTYSSFLSVYMIWELTVCVPDNYLIYIKYNLQLNVMLVKVLFTELLKSVNLVQRESTMIKLERIQICAKSAPVD